MIREMNISRSMSIDCTELFVFYCQVSSGSKSSSFSLLERERFTTSVQIPNASKEVIGEDGRHEADKEETEI